MSSLQVLVSLISVVLSGDCRIAQPWSPPLQEFLIPINRNMILLRLLERETNGTNLPTDVVRAIIEAQTTVNVSDLWNVLQHQLGAQYFDPTVSVLCIF